MLHLPPMCSLKTLSMLLLLYRHQGLTPLSKHFIKVSLSLFVGPFWFLHLLPGHNLIIMWSTGHRFRSQNQGCQGFQVLHLHQDHSTSMASLLTTFSLIEPRTHIQGPEFHMICSGAISSAVIIPVSYIIKGAFFLICILTAKPLLACFLRRSPRLF